MQASSATPADPVTCLRDTLGPSWVNDDDKPFFHVMPRDGWLNGELVIPGLPEQVVNCLTAQFCRAGE